MKKLLAVLALVCAVGCGGDGGGAFPNVAGVYVLTNQTSGCNFDPSVTVSQNGGNIIIQANDAGFIDASGTIDSAGNFDVAGGAGADSFSCNGIFTTTAANGACNTQGFNCNLTYTKQ